MTRLPYPESHDEVLSLKEHYRREQGKKKIDKMHKLNGITKGEKCKDCSHFFGKQYAKVYFKCELYGNTGGPATDWRANYQACGKFERNI